MLDVLPKAAAEDVLEDFAMLTRVPHSDVIQIVFRLEQVILDFIRAFHNTVVKAEHSDLVCQIVSRAPILNLKREWASTEFVDRAVGDAQLRYTPARRRRRCRRRCR
jgi:hypothetical protein